MSSSFSRILLATSGFVGGMVGVFVAITKLLPERAKIIIGYQLDAINGLQAEIKRQAETIAHLEIELDELRKELRGTHA